MQTFNWRHTAVLFTNTLPTIKMGDSPENTSIHSEHRTPPLAAPADNFIPLSFSSPINPRQGNNADLYPSQRQNFDPQFYSANRRHKNRNFMNRQYPLSRPNYDNRDQNQQQYQQKSHQKNHRNRQFRYQDTPNKSQKNNQDCYFHPSMLEDPWKSLEAKLEQQKANEKKELSDNDAAESPESQEDAVETDSSED